MISDYNEKMAKICDFDNDDMGVLLEDVYHFRLWVDYLRCSTYDKILDKTNLGTVSRIPGHSCTDSGLQRLILLQNSVLLASDKYGPFSEQEGTRRKQLIEPYSRSDHIGDLYAAQLELCSSEEHSDQSDWNKLANLGNRYQDRLLSVFG